MTTTTAASDAASRAESALAALAEHEAAWGTDLDTMPAGQRERRQRLHNAARRAAVELEDATTAEAERAAKLDAIRAAARDPRNIERTDRTPTPAARNRANPWDSGSGDDLLRMDTPIGLRTRALDAAEFAADLPDAARALLTGVIERDDAAASSALVLAGLDPAGDLLGGGVVLGVPVREVDGLGQVVDDQPVRLLRDGGVSRLCSSKRQNHAQCPSIDFSDHCRERSPS